MCIIQSSIVSTKQYWTVTVCNACKKQYEDIMHQSHRKKHHMPLGDIFRLWWRRGDRTV